MHNLTTYIHVIPFLHLTEVNFACIDGICYTFVNGYLSDLSRFFAARSLKLSPNKSTTTIFTI